MTIKETKQALFRRLTIRNLTLNVVCILIVLFGISWTVRYFWRYLDYEITNYRETQITNIYIGQEVRIRVDAIEGRTFTGRVSAISEAQVPSTRWFRRTIRPVTSSKYSNAYLSASTSSMLAMRTWHSSAPA